MKHYVYKTKRNLRFMTIMHDKTCYKDTIEHYRGNRIRTETGTKTCLHGNCKMKNGSVIVWIKDLRIFSCSM